jgi:hypothetical protein
MLCALVPSSLSRLAVSESFGDLESMVADQSDAACQPRKKMSRVASAPQLVAEGSSLPGMPQRLPFHESIAVSQVSLCHRCLGVVRFGWVQFGHSFNLVPKHIS